MELNEIIKNAYPELVEKDFRTVIILRNDSDGAGDYIERWDYEKPIPEGLKLGK
jgi:hypothetical protein